MFLNNVVLLLTIIVVLLFCCVMHIKNEVTYKNDLIISRAIHKAFINMFDWGYKNLIPKDTYALIEPFIEKG